MNRDEALEKAVKFAQAASDSSRTHERRQADALTSMAYSQIATLLDKPTTAK